MVAGATLVVTGALLVVTRTLLGTSATLVVKNADAADADGAIGSVQPSGSVLELVPSEMNVLGVQNAFARRLS